jgi:glc operon protein GlcG
LDGALLANLELAQMKANTVAALDAPRQEWVDKLAQASTGILSNPEIEPLLGGMPIKHNGVLVGAIGVTTLQGSVDAEAVEGAVAGL